MTEKVIIEHDKILTIFGKYDHLLDFPKLAKYLKQQIIFKWAKPTQFCIKYHFTKIKINHGRQQEDQIQFPWKH
jgi:hypothetical protein